MTVLDMGAGGGYSTELMARAVGPSGKVYGQDFETGARAKERFEARMKTDAMKNVIALARPFDDPLPADAANVDLITLLLFLPRHHLHGGRPRCDEQEAVRRAQARRFPRHRRPFGEAGAGTSVGKTLHRIEESALRGEVEAAGFKLVGSGDGSAIQRIRATSAFFSPRCRSTSSC